MLFVDVGHIAAEVELHLQSVGEGHFVAALKFLAVDEELLGEIINILTEKGIVK